MWDASKCDLCGDCLTRCQYVRYSKEQATAEIEALMKGEAAPILSRCITCCACREYCPTGADPYDLILKAQERTGAFPIRPEASVAFDHVSAIPSEVIPGSPGKPVLSLCVMESQLPDGALGGRLFEGMSMAKGGDYFCYIGYVHVARESPIARHAQAFIDKLATLGSDIVFLHDDCYAMVHTKVRDYGIAVPFSYKHLFEYLRDTLVRYHAEIRPLNMKVAYQRPCASRYTPEKDAFLDEIFHLIGVERMPRKHDGVNALCCSGPLINVDRERAMQIQRDNIDDALACGAEALVTLCPMCDRVLRRPTRDRGLEKIFITNLCRMALGELPRETGSPAAP